MKTHYIALCLLFALSISSFAQTVVKLKMPTQAVHALTVVTLFSEELPLNTPVILGAIGYEIKGGTEPYTLNWYKNDTLISTGNIVVIKPVAGSTYTLKAVDNNKCSSIVALNISASSKIKSNSFIDSNIFVTPTMATNRITVGFTENSTVDASVKIFDLKGVLMQQENITCSSNISLQLIPGIYFVVVEKNSLFHVQKIVVK